MYQRFLMLVLFVGCLILETSLAKESNNSTSDAMGKIYFGSPAELRPYQVQLYSRNDFICSGSILTSRWVLTAAHCLVNQTILQHGDLQIRAGSEYLFQGDLYYVQLAIQHQEFINNATLHLPRDIGLLKIYGEIKFYNRVQPIAIDVVTPDINIYEIAGWGKTELDNGSYMMLKMQGKKISLSECQYFWGYLENVICMVPAYGNSGTCRGDSGGPLIQIIDQKHYQIGLSTFSNSTCPGKYIPDVFTYVAPYYDWIKYNMWYYANY